MRGSYRWQKVFVTAIRAVLFRPIRLPFALFVVCLLAVTSVIVARAKGYEALPDGFYKEMGRVTRELACYGSLDLQDYVELHQALIERSRSEGSSFWQDVYSMDVKGKLHPMHGVIMSLSAIPAYLLLKEHAFTALPILLVVVIAAAILLTVKKLAPGQLLWLDVCLICFGTPALWHATYFGYDLFGAALVTSALYLLLSTPVLGGLLLGLSVFVRPTYVFYLPLVLVAFLAGGDKKKEAFCKATACASLVVVSFLLTNWHLWGSAITTINERMPFYTNGEVSFYKPSLSLQVFFSNWPEKLFGENTGFIAYSPGLLLLPWALFRTASHPFFKAEILLTIISLANVFLIFSFHCWSCSSNGNRFLLPVSTLAILIVLLAINRPKDLG